MAEEYKHIDVGTVDGVCTIRLNREHRDAKSDALIPEMIAELSRAFSEAQADDRVRAVVLDGKEKEGKGGVFSAGIDLHYLLDIEKEPAREVRVAKIMPLVELFDQLDKFDKPMIGVADGAAIGAGATLLMLCDRVIATPDLKIGYPEVHMDLFPSLSAIYALRRMDRPNQTVGSFARGEVYDAHKPLQRSAIMDLHLVDRMLPTDNADALKSAVAQAVTEALTDKEKFMQSPKRNHVEATHFNPSGHPDGNIAELINGVTQRYQDRSEPGRTELKAYTAGHLADAMTPGTARKLQDYMTALDARKPISTIPL